MEFDTIIRNGTLIDGSGAPRTKKDVGIIKERIAAVDDLSASSAMRIIDASGLAVAPGFIDIHSHADYTLPVLPTADSKIHQGVTTELVGNCGVSAAPLSPDMQKKGDANSLLGSYGLAWDWDSFGSFLDRLRSTGSSVNVAMLVGHGTVREKVMGMRNAAPTPEELMLMKEEVRRAMHEGAFGLSTGLIYAPGVYGDTNEIAELAQVAAEEGGIYTTHMRGEGSTLLEAVGEALEIGRRANIRVEVSHFKASQPSNWGKMRKAAAMIEGAKAAGLAVNADMYPYNASSTTLTSLLPAWALAGGEEVTLKRLKDPAERASMRAEMDESEVENPGYWQRVMVSFCPTFKEYEGLRLEEVAQKRGLPPSEVLMDLLYEAKLEAGMVQFGMSDENVEYGLSLPYVCIGSDGEGRSTEGRMAVGKPHPRNFGTFPRVLGYYSRQKGLFSLETAVHKMTGMTAARFGLQARGLVRSGYFADITVFNPDTVIDRATFTQPQQYPVGIEHVLVNGVPVIDCGRHTQATPGCVLTR